MNSVEHILPHHLCLKLVMSAATARYKKNPKLFLYKKRKFIVLVSIRKLDAHSLLTLTGKKRVYA